MSRYSENDSYVDPASGTLKNLLGIRDPSKLDAVEADLVAVRSRQLTLRQISGRFDLAHLQAIHKYLFQDLYVWAGQLRRVDISKGGSWFAHHAHIVSAAAYVFGQLAHEKILAGLDLDAFSLRCAFYFGEINALHPFRDGSGRATREFLSYVAHKNGVIIDWASLSQQEIVDASTESFYGRNTKLEKLIRKAIS